MNKWIQYCIMGIAYFPLFACKSQQIVQAKYNFTGGVYEQKYNTMPGIGKGSSKGAPLATSLYIYQATKLSQLDSLSGSFCSRIQGSLIATIQSNSMGQFNAQLKPGVYSVFVRAENAYYIPFFSGTEWTALFEIKADTATNLDIIVRGSTNFQ